MSNDPNDYERLWHCERTRTITIDAGDIGEVTPTVTYTFYGGDLGKGYEVTDIVCPLPDPFDHIDIGGYLLYAHMKTIEQYLSMSEPDFDTTDKVRW